MKNKRYIRIFFAATIIAICSFSTSCDSKKNDAAWWEGERVRVELEQNLALKTYRFDQAAGNDFEALQKLKSVMPPLAEQLKKLRVQRQQLESEVASNESQWPELRDALLQDHRHQLIGKTFENLRSVSGSEYKNVTVAQIDNAGVTVRHDAGSARLRIGDLDATQQAFFGLDADLALVAETKEREQGAAYDEWIDKQLVAVNEAKERKAEIADNLREASEMKRSQILAMQQTAARERPLALGSAPVSSRFSRFYGSSSSRTPTYRYYYNNSSCYSTTPRVSVGSTYVGSNRTNSAVRPFSAAVQSYGGGSNCPSPRPTFNDQNSPNSPIVSQP